MVVAQFSLIGFDAFNYVRAYARAFVAMDFLTSNGRVAYEFLAKKML